MPASPKLVLVPNSSDWPIWGSEVVISNWGNVLEFSRLTPTSLGLNACCVLAKAFMRVKPKCCSQVRFEDNTTELDSEITWLPADSCCGNPSKEPVAPNGSLVG